MRISPISYIANSVQNNTKNRYSKYLGNTRLMPLQNDTVCFKGGDKKTIGHQPFYRLIGKSEYQALINGESVRSSGYVTSDPRGWGAKSWDRAFGYVREENSYFITFKPNQFTEIVDRRDNEKDTRYTIEEEYSLKNITNIRRGINAHGELIWAENLEESKRKDISNKQENINKLIEEYFENNKKESKLELASYTKEFPEIVEKFEKKVDYSNQDDVNNLAYLICRANSDKYLPEYRKCIECFKKDIFPNSEVLSFYSKHGDTEDLDFVLDLIQEKKYDIYNDLSSALNNLAGNKDTPRVIEKLNNEDFGNLSILTGFLLKKDDNGGFLSLIESVFTKICKPTKNEEEELFQSCTILNGLEYFEKFGNKDSLKFLVEKIYPQKVFCKGDLADINHTIHKLSKKFKT
jgi:hypothetical protein